MQHKHVEIQCQMCNKWVTRHPSCKFCKPCALSRNSYKQKEVPQISCVQCNKIFKRVEQRIKFCSKECQIIYRNKEVNQNWENRKPVLKYKKSGIKKYNVEITSNMKIVQA